MPDKIKEAFEATKSNGIFLDEQDFRDNLTKDPKAVFDLFKSDKAHGDLFLDYSDFEASLGLKKKDFQDFNQKYGTSYTREQFTGQEPISPPTSDIVSPLPSSQPKSTIPSVSTGKLPGLEIQVEKPVSTQAVDNKDLALTVESREQRKQFLGEVNTGILESINKQPDLYMSQKDMPTMYGEKVIPAGTPNVDNIAKAVDLYAEKIKKETGRDLTSFDKQYVVQSTLSSLKVKKQTQNAAMLTDLEFQKQKKLPLTAITGIKNIKGEVVKENVFQENIKQTVAQEQQRLEQIAKTPNKEISAEFKPEIEGLSAQVKGTADALNKEKQESFTAQFTQHQNEIYNQYNQLVQSGQMPADAANAEMKQKIEALGKQLENDTNALYAPKFNQLKQETEEKSKEIQTRYNRKVQAQFNLEKEKTNKRIQAEVSKYSTGLPKGYLEEYQAAFQKNFDSQMKLDGLQKTADFANLGNFEKMQTAIMAGWGDVAGTVGGSLSYVGVNTGELQNWVAQSGLYNELPVFSGESIWDNVTNTDWWIANGVRSIPFTIATMPIGLAGGAGAGMLAKALGATRRAEMIASVVGGGLIGWDAEKFLEQGSAFNDAINEGKTALEAAQIATAVGKYNLATIPLNIAQMLPVFGNAFKFLGSAAIEAGSGYLEETAQGWAQAKAKAQSEGKDVAYLDYMTSPQAIEEGIIGAGMSQGFTLFSLNSTPDIDKQINALMTSLGTGGENQASFMLEVMKNNGAIDDKQYEQAKALLNYTLNGINQAQSINVEDDVKAALVNKFVAIEKAKELLTDNENDLASQAAKELIAEKEKEIKDILKGSEPVYFIKIQGNDIPVISTKEQVDAILSNPKMLPFFEIQAHNDVKTQASIDEAYSKQNENKQKNNEANGEVVLGGVREAGNEGEVRKEGEQLREEEVAKTIAQETEEETAKRFEQEKVAQDEKIAAFQQQFGYEPYNPFSSMPAQVGATIMRVQDELPVSLTAIEEASKHLYDEYKRLEAAKKSDSRQMTIPQIEAIQQELDQEITDLENYKNKLYENAGETEATPLGQDNRSAEEGARTEPTAKPKAEEVERTPATEANVVKNPILKRLNRGFLKIGTTIFDNAKQLMDKAKELTGKGEKVQFNITMPDGSQKTVKRVHSSVVDGFYSNTENALEQVKQDKMSGNQWATQLLSRGANKEEMAWTGLEGFLKENAAKSISKADIQQYLKDNSISVVEVVKGRPEIDIKDLDVEFDGSGFKIKYLGEGRLIMPYITLSQIGLTEEDTYEEDFDYYSAQEDAKKAAIEEILGREDGEVKFSAYQLEGEKENYKEVLVTMPSKKIIAPLTQSEFYQKELGLTDAQIDELDDNDERLNDVFKKWNAYENEYHSKNVKAQKKQFKSSHFDEPNILVHLRMNTRTDSKGNKVLFLEEVQSDWGQEGKKRGFEKPANVQAIEELKKEKQKVLDSSKSYQLLNDKTEGNLSINVFDAIQQIATNMIDNKYSTEESRKKRFLQDIEGTLGYWSNQGNAVPKMNQDELSNFYNVYIKELKNNSEKISGYDTSYRLASVENEIKDINKKILDFAEKSGMPTAPFVTDTNAWTKLGFKVALKEAIKQGAAKIAWTTGEQQNERYDLRKQVDKIEIVKREGADSYRAKTYKDGKILEDQDYIAFNQLEGMFGKEIAKKVQDGETIFEGEGLAVGGKGMKGFYGSPTEGKLGIIGEIAKSLFKQEPRTVKLDTGRNENYKYIKDKRENGKVVVDYKGNKKFFDDFSSAQKWVNENIGDGTTQYSIDITPELKEQVEEGLPLFHYNDKGEILGFTHNGKIYLNGEKITAKTTMEEAGHIWLNWAKENSIDLYKAGLSKVKSSKYLSDVEANKNYQKEALKLGKKGSPAYNTYMKEEALAKAIADNGAKFVTETRKNDFIQWVSEMWKQVAQAFGIRNLSTNEIKALSLEEFAKRAAADVFARDQFSDNILDIAEELNKSPQEVERTYSKYLGAKAIEDITLDDYRAARAIGDKNKLEVTAKAFDALLQVENAETSVSPSAKKNAEKKMKEADEKALKEAARIMEHIDEIRSKLQENGVIEAIHCKWGK